MEVTTKTTGTKSLETLQIKGVIVIGGGTMGRGIAQVFLQSALPVTLVDVNFEVLEQAKEEISHRIYRQEKKGKLPQGVTSSEVLQKLTCSQELSGHSGNLVIEAIVEKLEVKKELFKKLSEGYPTDVILASNTSSFSISEMSCEVSHPERMLGIHFFNPAPIMPLVEIVKGVETDQQVIKVIENLLREANKTTVTVKDTPGFIVNRVARPFYNEALKILGENVTSVESVDTILRGAGFTMGPFELQDLIGVDINFATTMSLYEAYFHDSRFRPHPIQEKMVKSKRLGRKTGKGFYSYDHV
jgi:3-hydroxybutyryl-CoA dehydrogenase